MPFKKIVALGWAVAGLISIMMNHITIGVLMFILSELINMQDERHNG